MDVPEEESEFVLEGDLLAKLEGIARDWVHTFKQNDRARSRSLLFWGPFALARIVEEKAKEWAAKLEVELEESFEVRVLDPLSTWRPT